MAGAALAMQPYLPYRQLDKPNRKEDKGKRDAETKHYKLDCSQPVRARPDDAQSCSHHREADRYHAKRD